MKTHIITSRYTRVLAGILGAIGLVALLSSPVWAEAKKTYFTIVETPVGIPAMGEMFTDGPRMFILGAESAYEETATDPRLTGPKVIHYDAVFDLPAFTGRMWGRSHKQHQDGTWDGYWTGTRTPFTDPDGTPHVRSTITSLAVGSGSFAGLVVRWDITAVDAAPGTPMSGTGYIVEAKGGPSERPMTWRATRTEELVIHEGMFLPSGPLGAMGTFDLLSEVGVGMHIGRSTNDGFGLVDLRSGGISGSGYLATASKERLDWVAKGSVDLATGEATVTVHFAGGTGRFEAAVGEMSGTFAPVWEGGPLVLHSTYDWSGKGTIRY